MSEEFAFDVSECHAVINLSASSTPLEIVTKHALLDFYNAVNKYFVKGLTNHNSGYYFNFAFSLVSDLVEDDDPDVRVMLQYTDRQEDSQDVHICAVGGKDCKYVMSELIMPAYSYLISKCGKLNFEIHESHFRRFGAPVYCVPTKNAKDLDCPGIDPRKWVTAAESPKLNDENARELSKDVYNYISKTNIFG